MRRAATIFTILVFTVVIGGFLWRRGSQEPADRREFSPPEALKFSKLADPLAPDADASGEHGGRLQVRIVDPAGAPVAGAALVVRSGFAPIWAFTEADGTATLDGLQSAPASLAVLAFPHPGLEVDVEPSKEVREIALAARAQLPAALPDIPRSKCAGQLRSPGAGSLAKYEVLLLPHSAPSELGGMLPRSAVSDANGQFVFEGLAHGRYAVKVLPEWAGGGTWPDLVSAASRDLDFGENSHVVFVDLSSGAIEGEVRDGEGRALEGALVLVNEANNEARVWPPTSCGLDGRFRIVDLPAGKYRVSCRAGEGVLTIEELSVVAGATTQAAITPFAARKQR